MHRRRLGAGYLRITLTAPGDTEWAVNEIRLYADGSDAAATLQAEQATQEPSAKLLHTVTGAHDVYLVAAGGERTAAVDWLTFRK